MKKLIPKMPGVGYHPLKYLSDVSAVDARKNISAVAHMPYPADPLVEPEFEGLTFFQVALIKQANTAACGSLPALEFFSDRMIGRPAQININVGPTETYEAFLDKIAEEEAKIIDVESKELGI